MATVFLSPAFNGVPQLGESLVLLNGGLLYTYQAGSSTPADTYTTSAGNVKNTNPIQLDADGRPPHEIWLVSGQSYKFVLTDSLGNPVGNPLDNVVGVNDIASITPYLPPTIAGYANLPTVAAGGTGDAITAAFSPAITLVDKLTVIVQASAANTVTNPTLNANGTGNVTIVKGSNAALAANDIPGANYFAIFTYNGSLGKWVLDNPATGVFVPPSASDIGIQCARKNLSCSTTGLSSIMTISADQILLQTAGGSLYKATSVSLTNDLTASGANGLDTGTVAASTEYHFYVIWNGATLASLSSLSPTSPTLPGGYTYYARVCSIFTDGTGNKFLLSFQQTDNRAQYRPLSGTNTTAFPAIASGSTGSVITAKSVTGIIPSTAKILYGRIHTTGSAANVSIYTNSFSGSFFADFQVGGGAAYASNYQSFDCILESTNIYYSSNAAGSELTATGWIDNI